MYTYISIGSQVWKQMDNAKIRMSKNWPKISFKKRVKTHINDIRLNSEKLK